MSGALEITRYRSEHKEAVAQLQTVLWSPDPAANRRYLEWKYEANPWATAPRIYLGLRDGVVVGMRGFYESRWEVGTPVRVVAVPLADDQAIAAGERNTGLVAQIMRAALADLAAEGVDYVFSLSAGSVTLLGSLAQGWKSAGKHEPMVRREPGVHRRAAVRERIRNMPVLWRWSGLVRSADERRPFRRLDAAPSPSGVAIAREPRPDAMAELCARRGHDGRLRHVRSREYLAWRFANPMYEYRFLYRAQGERLDGYLVLRAQKMRLHPTPRVCIADLEGSDARVRAELLAAAIDTGRFAELVAWGARISPHERALLAERGFEPLEPARGVRGVRGGPCALVRATRASGEAEWSLGAHALLDPASWDLRMLDSMAG